MKLLKMYSTNERYDEFLILKQAQTLFNIYQGKVHIVVNCRN